MKITVELLDGGIKKINLEGTMDIEGSDRIALSLSKETSLEKSFIVMDLSEVRFMASVGLGMLVQAYKAVKLRKGKMVLLNPQPVVLLALEKTRITEILPVYGDLPAARAAVLDPSAEM